MLFLFTPVLLILFWALLRAINEMGQGTTGVAGGVKLIVESTIARARLPRYEPLLFGVRTASGLSLLAAILIAIRIRTSIVR